MGHFTPMSKEKVRDAAAKGLRHLARSIQHDIKELVSMEVEVDQENVTYTIVVKRDKE
jgi:hypothetical protein